MSRYDLLLIPRLTPPQPNRRVLARPRLLERLREAVDYRLTIVQAGTGYGKTTALAALQGDALPLFWYTLDASDRDPQQFLSYLIAAFRTRLHDVAEVPIALLTELGNGGAVRAAQVIDALINALADNLDGPTILVLDDYQSVGGVAEIGTLVERFLTFLPAQLHVILSTLHPVSMGALGTWRGRGEVLDIGRADLAFRSDEVGALFRQNYGMSLGAEEVALLQNKTEGWPIVLQLIWQGLRSGAVNVQELLAGGIPAGPVGATATLFHYLARELLDRQPPEIAAFLRETAVLDELTPGACAAVRGEAESTASAAHLRELDALDLFVVALSSESWRYHHLFHDFLRAQGAADLAATRLRHQRAAVWYTACGAPDEAIGHWLAAQAYNEAATAIETIGEALLQAGRLNRLAGWIDSLPPDILAQHPRLHALLGDTYRLRSLFDNALAWYAQAEIGWRARDDAAGVSRALRGQALVYLDTVRAAQAETLLQEALRLADGTPDREARARLLMLMAENKLNLGKPAEAETLRREAEMLRNEAPDDNTLDARVKLRTGRLTEARQALEALAEAEERAARTAPEGAIGPPRAHRETVLLLSLVDALMGHSARAYALAQEGIALGGRLESPFITAVGYMRMGHALQMMNAGPGSAGSRGAGSGSAGPRGTEAADDAAGWYRQAILLGDKLAVRRTRAEAMWGLTRAYGYGGDLELAAAAAAEGVEIATDSGDVWMLALASIALGAGYALAGEYTRALPILTRALNAFRECSDTFGRAAARLWMAHVYLELARGAGAAPGALQTDMPKESGQGAMRHFIASAQELLAICETNGYDFLFTRPSLLGPPDERMMAPLLLAARAHTIRPAYVARLLTAMGIPDIKVHPGYQLRVQTLGAFRVWRGNEEVEARAWQRDKARQLFQLLLAERSAQEQGEGRWLQRDQIVERLWPQLAPETAARDFKVALNALVRALEPATAPARSFYFVERNGAAYRLRPEADLRVDAFEFEMHCKQGLHSPLNDGAVASLRAATALYAGDFLPDALYDDWTANARTRLLTFYLRAAERLAEALVGRSCLDEAIEVCEAILSHDNCWERAWQLLIAAWARQGNRAQARRVCARCTETLRAELDVPPSAETLALCTELGG